MATLEITQKVKDEYGTLIRYAKLRNLDYRLLRQVARGMKVSKKCVEVLKKDGFMQ